VAYRGRGGFNPPPPIPKSQYIYSKNKFEKLVHLVGFIIRIYHDARSAGRHSIFIPKINLRN